MRAVLQYGVYEHSTVGVCGPLKVSFMNTEWNDSLIGAVREGMNLVNYLLFVFGK